MHYPAGDIGLDGATFNVRQGEFVFLVGSTGSGKSTIMRLLIKEREPTARHDPRRRPRPRDDGAQKIPYYRRNIGVVFQDFKLLPNRTVYDNIAYALSATGATRKEIRAKVPDVLRLTGLSTKLHNFPDQLSGGEKQRVVGRARVRQPPAAAARRRADRQPRPDDVARDHAAALPDLPHRHDGHGRRRTTRTWSTACAAASSSCRAGGSSATRRAACTPSASRRPTSSAA